MTSAGDAYDFILTGAGSVGCAVAGWLSEPGRWCVLLPQTNPDPRVDWMFEREPENE